MRDVVPYDLPEVDQAIIQNLIEVATGQEGGAGAVNGDVAH